MDFPLCLLFSNLTYTLIGCWFWSYNSQFNFPFLQFYLKMEFGSKNRNENIILCTIFQSLHCINLYYYFYTSRIYRISWHCSSLLYPCTDIFISLRILNLLLYKSCGSKYISLPSSRPCFFIYILIPIPSQWRCNIGKHNKAVEELSRCLCMLLLLKLCKIILQPNPMQVYSKVSHTAFSVWLLGKYL